MKRCTSQLTQVGAPRRGLVRSHAVTWVPVLAALAWLAGCVVPADSSPNGQIEATQQGIAGGARPTDGQFPATVLDRKSVV